MLLKNLDKVLNQIVQAGIEPGPSVYKAGLLPAIPQNCDIKQLSINIYVARAPKFLCARNLHQLYGQK